MTLEEPRRIAPMSFESTRQWLQDLSRNIRAETIQPLHQFLEAQVGATRKTLKHTPVEYGVRGGGELAANLHKKLAVWVPALRAVRALRQQLVLGQPTDLAARRLGVCVLRMAAGRHPREIERGMPSKFGKIDFGLRQKIRLFSQPTSQQNALAIDLVVQFSDLFPSLTFVPTLQERRDMARKLREDRSDLVDKILRAGVLSKEEVNALRQMEADASRVGARFVLAPQDARFVFAPQEDRSAPAKSDAVDSDLAPGAASTPVKHEGGLRPD